MAYDANSVDTLVNFIQDGWRAKRITFRYFGDGKRRPMVHRFEVRGGVSFMDLMAENVTQNNALLRRLTAHKIRPRGKSITQQLPYSEQPIRSPLRSTDDIEPRSP